ncbi:MAG: MBL fold hydrolase [Bacteroidetes bacterium GWA2_31_9]|nr:MAG: MBL fold hydrolase [Bacteroidetes bacterium GWA2_31_9]
MNIASLVFNQFQVNTYIVYDETDECIIIDPACYTQREKETLLQFIEDNNLKPIKIIITHCHVDHILGNKFISEKFKISIQAHQADIALLSSSVEYGSVYGFDVEKSPVVSKTIADNEIIKFGNSSLKAIHVSGHSPGSLCFYNEESKILVSGDVLFDGSIGRTDLPGGNYNELISGIKNKLLVLGDDVKVYPGHGTYTSIGRERKFNPFLK